MKKRKHVRFQKKALAERALAQPIITPEMKQWLHNVEKAADGFGKSLAGLVESMNKVADGICRAAESIRPELELQQLKWQSWQRNDLTDLLDERGINHDL